MLKKMNLPNKLTMLRIILVPIFVVFMCLPQDLKWPNYVAFGIFLLAAITDYIDGIISRKYNLVTEFGKIMDPLADKMLVASAFIMLTSLDIIPVYLTVVIILRDFFANSIRMFGANANETIAASLSGKIKTFTQMLALILALVNLAFFKYASFGIFIQKSILMSEISLFANIFMSVMVVVAVIATIWSLVDYIIKFKKYINVEK